MATTIPTNIDTTVQNNTTTTTDPSVLMANPSAPSISEFESREALESVRGEMAALEEKDFIQVNVDIPSATRVALGCLPKLRGHREQIVKEMPSFPITRLDKLETYALAAFWANARYMTAFQPETPIAPLLEELSEARDQLMEDASILAKRGMIDGSKLKEMRGRGPVAHRDLPSDVAALVSLFRGNWSSLQGRTAVTIAELDRAETQANRLERMLAVKDHGPKDIAEVTATRVRAFTLFVTAYEELRHAITYLRRKEQDAATIAPSLYTARARRKNGGDEVEDTSPIPPPIPAPVVTQPGAPAGSAPVAPVAAGMPGSSPFEPR